MGNEQEEAVLSQKREGGGGGDGDEILRLERSGPLYLDRDLDLERKVCPCGRGSTVPRVLYQRYSTVHSAQYFTQSHTVTVPHGHGRGWPAMRAVIGLVISWTLCQLSQLRY